MSPGSHRTSRRRRGLSLLVTRARDDQPGVLTEASAETGPALPWLPAAVGGGVLAAAIGWVLCALTAVLGWLGANASTLPKALGAGSQLWFLGNGAGARFGPVDWTLVPLGLSLLFVVLVSWVSAFAARQAVRQTDLDPGGLTLRVAGLVTAGYTGLLLLLCIVVGQPAQTGRALLGGVLIGGLGAWWGTTRVTRYRIGRAWPAWARPVPRAVLTAVSTYVALGGALVVGALIRRADRIASLTSHLDLGVLGGLVMLVVQLAYLPDLVLWGGAYLVGSGFTLGDGSLVSPVVTKVGLLPAVPLSAAVPHAHIGSDAALLWLLGGAAPGVVAALVVGRARPLARFDETALVGGLAGVVTGLVCAFVTGLSRGSLGTGRLASVGPRPLELTVMAVTLMGLAGMLTGLVRGLLRHRAWAAGREETVEEDVTSPDEEDEPTRRVPR